MGDYAERPYSKRQRTVNVLVTGFGAFRYTTRNPSWETAKLVSKLGVPSMDPLKQVAIDISYVPVEYAFTASAVQYFYGLSDHKPDLPADMMQDREVAARCDFDPHKHYDVVLHIGQGRHGGIQLETVAHRLGYRLLDAANQLPPVAEESLGATDADAQTPEQFMTKQERCAGMARGFLIPDECLAHLGQDGQLETTLDTRKLADLMRKRFPDILTNKSENAGRYLCEFIYFGSLMASYQAQRKTEPPSNAEGVKVLFMHVPPENDPLSITDMATVVQGVLEEIVKDVRGGRLASSS